MIKLIRITILLLFLTACKKEQTACEIWQVQDVCIPKHLGVVCGGSTTNEIHVCGDDLSLARSHVEKVVRDDADVTIKRRYLKQVP